MATMLESGIISYETLEGLEKMIRYLPELGSEIYLNIRLSKDS